MAAFEIQGKLHKKFDTEQKSQTFQVREFVLLVNSSGYDNYINFQLTQDRCDIINTIPEGEDLKVHFDLRGREWNGKYFTNLNAFKVESNSQAASDEQWPEAQDEERFNNGTAGGDVIGEEDEYPF